MLKNLWRMAEGYRTRYAIGLGWSVLAAFCAGIPFVVLYLVLTELFEKGLQADSGKLWGLVGVMALGFVLQVIFAWRGTLGTMPTSQQMVGHWQIKLGEHLRRLSMGFFNGRQAGDLTTLITSDVQMVSIIFYIFIPRIVTNTVLATTIGLLSFFVDWRMALALLVGVPVAFGVLRLSEGRIAALGRRRQAALVETNTRLVEYVQGMPVLKAFKQTGPNFAKLDRAIARFRDENLRLLMPLAFFTIAFAVTLELGISFVIIAGSYLVLGGTITPPIFLIFLILTLRFYGPLQEVGSFLSELRLLVGSMQRMLDLAYTPPLPEPAEEPLLKHFDIEFEKVSFGYEKAEVLKKVSFHVPQHSITALVGPSGSGKSTITSLIARFWDVKEGTVRVGGVDVRDLKTDYLLSQISMVFQNVYLFNETIESNLRFGKPTATHEEIVEAARLARCHDFIMALPEGYQTRVGEGGAALSGGEKQRLSIARAILKDAPIVLLDEATASLDPENEQLIQQAINALVKRKTLIIIAHRLSTIQSADQILVLESGQIVEQGRHRDLVKAGGLYSRFWAERQKARSWKVGQPVADAAQI
jgi:ATP-binding cassette subfamily B protein